MWELCCFIGTVIGLKNVKVKGMFGKIERPFISVAICPIQSSRLLKSW